MRIFFCFLLLIVVSQHAKAQELTITGQVYDDDTGQPISNAHVELLGSRYADVTDASGRFDVLIIKSEKENMMMEVSHLSYRDTVVSLSVRMIVENAVDGVYDLKIRMEVGVNELPVFDVMDDRPPELVYGSARHSIADYEMMGDQILLLTYEKTLRKQATLYLADNEMTLLDSLDLPERIRPRGFYKDYTDRIFLESIGGVFFIEADTSGIRFEEVNGSEFKNRIVPVVDTVGGQLLFSTWTERFPAFDYYGFDENDSSYHHIRQIADEFMLELCRAEYKYLNTRDKLKLFRLELETGIEREVLACVSAFEEGLYYDPIHAPLFVWQDTIYIFDHHNNSLFVHGKDQSPIDSVAIDYHSPGKVMGNPFTDRLVMDEGTGDIYAIFQAQGGQCTLGRISTVTGDIAERIDLDYDYPDGIRVLNGEVFYIYRPYESIQKRYLYKEDVKK